MLQTKFYITKRRNGFYYICIKYPDGRAGWKTGWKSTKCRRKPEAYNFLKTYEETLATSKDTHVPSFSEFLKTYKSIQSSVIRKSTIELYTKLADKFVKLNSDKPLDTYTSLQFEQSRAQEIASGISVTRMNMYTRTIKALFNFACKQNIISSNPFENVKQIKQPKSTPSYFSFSNLEKIISLTDNQLLKGIFLFAFFTGARISEILNLRWSDIDFKNNQIRISNSDDFITKSGKERVIPFHQKVQELFSTMGKSTEFVFVKSHNHRYSRAYVTHRFKHYSRKAGLPENIHLHSCRHSFASLCVQSGVDLYAVKALLGHSNITTTEIYSHLSPSHLQSAINKIQV
ncbi:MAG: tyrosine-type recombinase/integrase [Bacteroidota bacterium]